MSCHPLQKTLLWAESLLDCLLVPYLYSWLRHCLLCLCCPERMHMPELQIPGHSRNPPENKKAYIEGIRQAGRLWCPTFPYMAVKSTEKVGRGLPRGFLSFLNPRAPNSCLYVGIIASQRSRVRSKQGKEVLERKILIFSLKTCGFACIFGMNNTIFFKGFCFHFLEILFL